MQKSKKPQMEVVVVPNIILPPFPTIVLEKKISPRPDLTAPQGIRESQVFEEIPL